MLDIMKKEEQRLQKKIRSAINCILYINYTIQI